MRKAQKQRLLDLLSTLYEAHKVIGENINHTNIEMVQILLADCQNVAIHMGNIIEQSEDAEHFSVHLLEEYCQILFQTYEKFSICANGDKITKQLDKALLCVDHSIKENIKIRLEIVFLPYKAAMWDSLESVWKVAEADPDCDAYVIPIPYYNKKPDQGLGEMHYEGTEYPPYVPIVDWRDYHLEARCPDVVFIHNPYDNQNLVTQVHNRYFSENLRKYAGILCYIPYFSVTSSVSPSFALLPAVLYSDFVIVQSEKIRQQYLSVWEHLIQKEEKDLPILKAIQKKILALGSPKHDFAFDTDDQYADIPNEWKHLIIRPDGRRKKIVFYNTSLSTLLRKSIDENNKISDRYLQKIESVLHIFKTRDDAVLLWRPHPLMRNTFSAMLPELYPKYLQIVDTYRNEGYGIYDDSSDLHKAIRICDMYYGDSSSVMPLVQAVGKTILVQNVNITDYTKCLDANILLYDGQYVWSTAVSFNGLFRMDLKDYELKYIGNFPNEKAVRYDLFSNAVDHNGKIYFCPYNANNIAIYDKKHFTFSSIQLKESISDINGKFSSILANGKYIYMQGNNTYTIVRIDTETNNIFYIENWIKDVEQNQSGDFNPYIRRGCIHKDDLYYFSPPKKGLLHINTKKLSSEWIPLQYNTTNGFADILSDGELLWLLPEDVENADCFISCFDPETFEFFELKKIDQASTFCLINEYIYYFSRSQPYIYRIDKRTKQIMTFPIEREIYKCCPIEDKILMITHLTGELYIFDTIKLTTTKIRLVLDEKKLPRLDYPEMVEESLKKNKLVLESAVINLNDLLEINPINTVCQSDANIGGSGLRIYEYMKTEVLL